MTGLYDTRESLEYTLEWAMRNLDSAQFFPIGNLAGTAFDIRMRKEGRVLVDGINGYPIFDGHHVVVRPYNMTPYEQHVITDNMYEKFYSLKNCLRRLGRSSNKLLSLGIMIYTNFKGGISRVIQGREHLAHLEFLRSVG